MSNTEQTPSAPNNVGRSLLIIIAALLVGTVWYTVAAKNNTDKTLKDTKQVSDTTANNTKTDAYSGWKSYSYEGISFKYPGDWFAGQYGSAYRLYVRNADVDLSKVATPDNFQNLWISVDTDETSAAREAAIKNGKSDYRVVGGEVKTSTIKSGDLTINTYEYQTDGGVTLEAYWTGKNGKRYMATNSTEVGQQNQTDMVTTLKKLLATVTLQ